MQHDLAALGQLRGASRSVALLPLRILGLAWAFGEARTDAIFIRAFLMTPGFDSAGSAENCARHSVNAKRLALRN
jgi:hypothetical protein